MPSFWTLDRVADALRVRGRGSAPRGSAVLSGVSTDTRAMGPGSLFVALRGERFDAHDFLVEAVARGAGAVVISRPERGAGLGVPVYVVDDTLAALAALARYWRRAWGGPVIGVGGSNGKTTTKELIRSALERVLEVHATTGNLNNLVGVPLTLLAIPGRADVAVVEMGMNVPGEMERLRAAAEPDLAVLTCLAEEHLEGLGSLEGVLREESLLFDRTAVAIVPASQPELVAAARDRSRRVVTAGLEAGDLCATRWGLEADGRGWLEVEGVTVRLPIRGVHNLRNAMLALAVARECGVSVAQAAPGLESVQLPPMRVAWEPMGRATVINDAYNASPASMRAALELLEALDRGRQRVAVLGPMRELGSHTARLHDEVARRALASSIDLIAGLGEMATALEAAAAGDPRVVTATELEDLWRALEPRLAPDAIILLKASRGVHLERVIPSLAAWASRSCSTTS